MSLEEKLSAIREDFVQQAPPEAVEIAHRATEDLRASGIMDGVTGVGDDLPAFELEDTEGNLVRSADLVAGGPLVLAFFRGKW